MNDEPIFVIAAGWSCSLYKRIRDLTRWGHVIGVNDAALYADVHTAVTMDRLWLEHRLAAMDELRIPLWYRDNTAKNVQPGPLHIPFAGNIKMMRMSEASTELWGDNSGACALNRAYQMKPQRIYLFGFDMQKGPGGQSHWYSPYPWKSGGGAKPGTMAGWARSFDIKAKQFAAAGIAVKSVNPHTLVKAFPVISFKEFEQEVM